jgi:hypothetical protein
MTYRMGCFPLLREGGWISKNVSTSTLTQTELEVKKAEACPPFSSVSNSKKWSHLRDPADPDRANNFPILVPSRDADEPPVAAQSDLIWRGNLLLGRSLDELQNNL